MRCRRRVEKIPRKFVDRNEWGTNRGRRRKEAPRNKQVENIYLHHEEIETSRRIYACLCMS